MHGARGGAKAAVAHANWKHGMRSADIVQLRKLVTALGRESQELAASMEKL
jgi:hypothetical protein